MSKDLDVGIKTLSELYNQKRGISPLMALKLAEYFGTTPQFWTTLQSNYDLYQAWKKDRDTIAAISSVEAA